MWFGRQHLNDYFDVENMSQFVEVVLIRIFQYSNTLGINAETMPWCMSKHYEFAMWNGWSKEVKSTNPSDPWILSGPYLVSYVWFQSFCWPPPPIVARIGTSIHHLAQPRNYHLDFVPDTEIYIINFSIPCCDSSHMLMLMHEHSTSVVFPHILDITLPQAHS